jgi:YD repeat-containing protein
MDPAIPESTKRSFWRPPIWKWALFALMIAFAAAVFFWPAPPVKVELLPFSNTPPAWDGSYPFLIITPVAGPKKPTFKSAISMVPPTVRHDSHLNEFDVDLHTGRFILRQTDLFVPDAMPLSLTRTYITWDYHRRAFGVAANHPYDICPTGDHFPYTYMDMNLEDGSAVHMSRISKGTGYADAVFRYDQSSSEFFGAQTAWNGNGWTLTFSDGRKFHYPDSYNAKNCAQGAPTLIEDSQGHHIELKRDTKRNLAALISPSGHTITFKYDSADRIVEAKDDLGNLRQYFYGMSGHVEAVSDATHVLYRFEYAPLIREAGYDPWLLTRVLDADWNVLLENKYHWYRVSQQKLADGEVFQYEYTLNDRDVLQTTVTLPSGEKKQFSFRDGRQIQ